MSDPFNPGHYRGGYARLYRIAVPLYRRAHKTPRRNVRPAPMNIPDFNMRRVVALRLRWYPELLRRASNHPHADARLRGYRAELERVRSEERRVGKECRSRWS